MLHLINITYTATFDLNEQIMFAFQFKKQKKCKFEKTKILKLFCMLAGVGNKRGNIKNLHFHQGGN